MTDTDLCKGNSRNCTIFRKQKEPTKVQPPANEFLMSRLQNSIEMLSFHLTDTLEERVRTERKALQSLPKATCPNVLSAPLYKPVKQTAVLTNRCCGTLISGISVAVLRKLSGNKNRDRQETSTKDLIKGKFRSLHTDVGG